MDEKEKENKDVNKKRWKIKIIDNECEDYLDISSRVLLNKEIISIR